MRSSTRSAPDVTSLFVAAVALGLGRGAIIAALNAEGAELERASGRRILGSFHALYSLGSLTGAGVGGVIAERGVGPVLHLGLAAAIVALAVVVLRDGPAREPDLRPAPVRPEGEPGRGRLAPVALIAFVALFGQSACGDWSAIFLRDVAHVSPGVAAAGYGAYALSMIVVRLVGDRIAGAIGEVRVVRYGAALAGTGIMLALALPGAVTGAAGFAAVGGGSAVVLPIALRSAGRGARAVTTAGAAGFLGSLVGPLVIGASAAALGVRVALGWVVVSSVVLAVLAPAVRRAHAWL